MAQHIQRVLEVPESVAVGAALNIEHLTDLTLMVTGFSADTVLLQYSIDGGTTYRDLQAAITADATIEISFAATHLRADTTTYGSGTFVGTVRGYDIRTI